MNLPFETVTELTRAVQKLFPDRHLLPWNRFDIGGCEWWWMCLERGNPVFDQGKVMFVADAEWVPAGQVFVGMHAEKGLRHAEAWKPAGVMGDDWYWHEFVREMAGESFRGAWAAADTLYLAAGTPPGRDHWGYCLFDLDGDRLSLKVLEPPAAGEPILGAAASCGTIDELQSMLRDVDELGGDWRWIGIGLGRFFTFDPAGPDDTAECVSMIQAFPV